MLEANGAEVTRLMNHMEDVQFLADGMKVSVKNAPTRFGKVSYEIASRIARGRIDITIQPPDRQPPKTLVLRLRHPEGKPIRSVTLNGKRHRQFDRVNETLFFKATMNPMQIGVFY